MMAPFDYKVKIDNLLYQTERLTLANQEWTPPAYEKESVKGSANHARKGR